MFILFTTAEYEKDFKASLTKTIEMNSVPSAGDYETLIRSPGNIRPYYTIDHLSNFVDLVGMNSIDADYIRGLNIELCAALHLRNMFYSLNAKNAMELKQYFHASSYGVDTIKAAELGKTRPFKEGGEFGMQIQDTQEYPQSVNDRMNGLLIENLNYMRTNSISSSRLDLSFKRILDLKTSFSQQPHTTMEKFLFSWDTNRNYNLFVYTIGMDFVNLIPADGYAEHYNNDLSSGPIREIREILVDVVKKDKSISIRDIGGHELFDSRGFYA